MTIRLFKHLRFTRQEIDQYSGALKVTLNVDAYIPGINSGMYDKALHITVLQVRPFKFISWARWKFGTKEVLRSSITLNVDEMIALRDEINQILRLPFPATIDQHGE